MEYYSGMTTTPTTQGNPVAISSLVLGIVGLAGSVLVGGELTALIGALGLLAGFPGVTRSKTLDYRKGYNMAIFGMVMGGSAVIVSIGRAIGA
jgi:hypothetical protein